MLFYGFCYLNHSGGNGGNSSPLSVVPQNCSELTKTAEFYFNPVKIKYENQA